MQDTKLFETILGIQAPWRISRVALDTSGERVDLWAEHADTRWPCPECQQLPCHDHADERVWRHLDTCQYQTFLYARVPRIDCPTHGVRQVRVPWAETRSRFTILMQRLIIDLIQQCSTVTGACRIARITWDEAWRVMSRAVARGRARKVAVPIPYIGVDEKAFRKGHRYHTIVCDLEQSTVEFVAEDRKTESLAAYYQQLTDAQRAGLEAVAMDMWEPYIRATRDGVPDGDQRIVFDRFHIMREMTRAVDTVRKQEHRGFLRAGEDSPLTGTKYLWLFSDERRPHHYAESFATLQVLNLKPVASATLRTSRPRSTCTVVGWTSTHADAGGGQNLKRRVSRRRSARDRPANDFAAQHRERRPATEDGAGMSGGNPGGIFVPGESVVVVFVRKRSNQVSAPWNAC